MNLIGAMGNLFQTIGSLIEADFDVNKDETATLAILGRLFQTISGLMGVAETEEENDDS